MVSKFFHTRTLFTRDRSLAEILREKYPWLVAEWNGADWESEKTLVRRRLNALEVHIQDIEERMNQCQNIINLHAQGTQHRPRKPSLPEPDTE